MESLKKLRTLRGMFQKDVAALIGVEKSTYNKYETGASEPSFQILIKLADIFGTSTDEILGHTVSGMVAGAHISNMELEEVTNNLNQDGIAELIRYAKYLAQDSRYKKEQSAEAAI